MTPTPTQTVIHVRSRYIPGFLLYPGPVVGHCISSSVRRGADGPGFPGDGAVEAIAPGINVNPWGPARGPGVQAGRDRRQLRGEIGVHGFPRVGDHPGSRPGGVVFQSIIRAVPGVCAPPPAVLRPVAEVSLLDLWQVLRPLTASDRPFLKQQQRNQARRVERPAKEASAVSMERPRLSQEDEAGANRLTGGKAMTELLTLPDVKDQFAKLSPAETAIAAATEEYMPLTIDGIKDTKGYAKVHRARMSVMKMRTTIEKTRKQLKADSLAYGRTVDGEAKRLTALLEPTEAHLLTQLRAVDDEKSRIANEARLKAEAAEKARADAEAAEKKRLADEEAARIKARQDAEDERLRKARADLEAQAAKQRAAQEKLEADQRVVQAEKLRMIELDNERVRAEELKKAKEEAAERARVETEERRAREAKEKAAAEKAQAEAEEAARLRVEELRPDREKLLTVADAIRYLDIPKVSEAAEETRDLVSCALRDAEEQIRNIIKVME